MQPGSDLYVHTEGMFGAPLVSGGAFPRKAHSVHRGEYSADLAYARGRRHPPRSGSQYRAALLSFFVLVSLSGVLFAWAKSAGDGEG